jgi:hypothetical protein
MSEDNITLIHRGYEAYGRRDFPAGFALLHPKVDICQTAFLLRVAPIAAMRRHVTSSAN